MRYRFRRGSSELEVEFSEEIPAGQQELLSSLLEHFASILREEEVEDTVGESPASVGKKTRRGGPRKAFVSPAIEELVKDKWLVEKTTADVVKELKTRGIVAANEDNVNAALLRKVQAGRLARADRGGEWVWTVHTTA
jgi:hypothetical protein